MMQNYMMPACIGIIESYDDKGVQLSYFKRNVLKQNLIQNHENRFYRACVGNEEPCISSIGLSGLYV